MSGSKDLSSKAAKILIVITTWPSKEHPYLVYLFGGLNEKFTNLHFLIFNKPDDVAFAEQLIGKEAVSAVLSKAVYRWSFSLNPWKILKPIATFFMHPIATVRMIIHLRQTCFTFRKAMGQVLFFHTLIGKQFDLVYINALQTALHFSIQTFFKQTPVIVSSRGQDFDLHPEGFDHILQEITHLHVLGDYLERSAVQRGFSSTAITKIPPAILPIDKPRTLNSTRSEVRIISVSRLYWIKGYMHALKAIRLVLNKLGHDSLEYLIVGDGPVKEELMVEISRLSLQHCVRFVGWRSQSEIDEYLAQSDIFLSLSIGEGFNNAVMQAQQFGIPCVVSDAGGLPENVLHGQTGIVVPRYDAQAAAEALGELIANRASRERLGRQAQARMVSDFTLREQVERYTKLFESNLQR